MFKEYITYIIAIKSENSNYIKKNYIVNITTIDTKKYKLTIYKLQFCSLFFAFANVNIKRELLLINIKIYVKY